MTKAYLELLLKKHLEHTLNEQERLDLDNWYIHTGKSSAPLSDPQLYGQLLREMDATFPFVASLSVKRARLWPRIVAAAAAVALVVSGLYFFNYHIKGRINSSDLITQDVAPGQQSATLTLASGKKIRLSDAVNGDLVKEAGVVITKSADGQLIYRIQNSGTKANTTNVLSTNIGETYRLRLPDGSSVWLNAASSLTYNANLIANGKRSVELTGEGYFEVAKDKHHPFIVKTNKQEVEVLGTHFNINSYPDAPAVATTLLEGAVKVSSGKLRQLLRPGEQALNDGIKIQVGRADVETITDWKDGDFIFDSEKFESIIQKIERWYDVTFIYKKGAFEKVEFSGRVSRSKPLSSVLKALRVTGGLNFKIEGRRVIVM